jgi:hypothetical protein
MHRLRWAARSPRRKPDANGGASLRLLKNRRFTVAAPDFMFSDRRLQPSRCHASEF